jgi:hypothetical protein
MSIIKDKYETIFPQKKYLCDEVILAQAWKKTHSYIRRHNWYADVLELDSSTIDLENKLEEWAEQLNNGTYKVDTMRLILAPKNKPWYFSNESENEFDSWSPRMDGKETEGFELNLRPLAHLTIRDQTLATAVMLCLADAIETAQGPTDNNDFLAAQRQNVFSYGNRLHCDWLPHSHNRKQARFRWGNSQCYRQYYADYKTFLQRPRNICQYYSSIINPNKNLYVVSLDLEQFYEHIDVNALLSELKRLFNDYSKEFALDLEASDQIAFWRRVKKIFKWTWDDKDKDYSESMLNGVLPSGIPQGLVAGGFFSNAYLVGLDQKVGDCINRIYKENSLIIRDYCRYVDDIRIVVEVSNDIELDEVKCITEKMLGEMLDQHQKFLKTDIPIKLNTKKTIVIPYKQLSTQNNISSLMNMFQNVLSGTPDAESLRQAAGGLEGLLRMSNKLEDEFTGTANFLDLSKISTPHIDVRDDTLKRFVATRVVKSLRLRRSMTDLSEKVGNMESEMDNFTAGQILDHEFETAARKLIACWAGNPSLTLLLRCGLDLYPDPVLLTPVIDALKSKMYVPSNNSIFISEMRTAEYVTADLLRSAATYIGHNSTSVYPDSADLEGFREELASFARELLAQRIESPWYIKQQAMLYLISIGDYGFTIDTELQELNQYNMLRESMLYQQPQENMLLDQLTVSIVAQQISPNSKKYASWFIEFMGRLINIEDQKLALKIVFMNRPDLMTEIIKSKSMRNAKWKKEIPSEIRNSLNPGYSKDLKLIGCNQLSLLRIIQSGSNPFKQENALLLLIRAILLHKDSEDSLSKGATLYDLTVLCKDWGKIQNPKLDKEFLVVSFDKDFTSINEIDSDLRRIPTWVSKKFRWLYGLGRILRSCITSEYDFTSNTFLLREDHGLYKGIKSTWFTRRFGMNNHPTGLLTEPSPISPWLSELLIRLLQWPGIRQWGEFINDFDKVQKKEDLLRLIEERLAFQSKIFGSLSDTPFYILPASTTTEKKNGKIKVAIVQPLLPKMSDFNIKDPMHWTLSYRAKHRNHIASICNLVSSQLKATRSAHVTNNEEGNTAQQVDLIVFPELTIHPDDTDLLRRLSDVTKANIFAGLTFIKPNPKKNPINQALWLLRVERPTGREFMYVHQGKQNMTKSEQKMKIDGYRPYQLLIELGNIKEGITRITGAICYDATDLALVADLREVSDIFIIAAMNQDVQTFDNMVTALHYHMYQPVILANTGEFGGSTAQAPFNKFARQIAHIHGNQQVAVSIFEVDASAFKGKTTPIHIPDVKTPPAGYKGRD